MATRTDAARAEVVAAREGLSDDLVRLEAAGRAAIDIPARMRREPAKVVGAAAGAAFLLAGGPGRLLRRLRRAGRDDADATSNLPEDIRRSLKKRGADGERTRRELEKDFARYLESRSEKGRDVAFSSTAAALLSNLLKPLTQRAGRRLAEELFDADRATASESLKKVRDDRNASAKGRGR